MLRNKRVRIIKRILIIFLAIMFLTFLVPIPINRVYDAVEIKLNDPSYFVPCQVKIHGKYYWNLFTDDMFEGQVTVSDYKYTNEKMSKLYIGDDGYPLEYNYTDGYNVEGHQNRKTYFLGHLYSKSWFRQMVITVFSDNPVDKNSGGKSDGDWGGWNETDGYCIVPSVNNREEAIKVLVENKIIH